MVIKKRLENNIKSKIYYNVSLMAALITSLDNSNHIQYGENGHTEYSWSNSIQEKILQFSFQVTRTMDNGLTLQVALSPST